MGTWVRVSGKIDLNLYHICFINTLIKVSRVTNIVVLFLMNPLHIILHTIRLKIQSIITDITSLSTIT